MARPIVSTIASVNPTIAGEHSGGVLQIAPCFVHPRERPRLTMELLGPVDAAERQPRRTPRFAGRQAATPVFVFEQEQMRRHLALEARFGAIRAG